MMRKPPGMTDQQFGEFLAECAMGGPYGDVPTWGWVTLGVLVGAILVAHWLGWIG